VLSEMLRPKSFAGLFGAAPSIAIASLIVTVKHSGVADGRTQSFSMMFVGLAMVAYCAALTFLIGRFGALRSTVIALGAWAAVAFVAYAVVIAVRP